jgi:hypothetical protein
MKKAIALLLALAVIGGAAFAQSKANVYIEGELQLWNLEPLSNHAYNYADVTFSGSNDTAGYSLTLAGTADNLLNNAAVRDWKVDYKIFDNALVVTTGNLRNGTYRMGDVWGAYYFTDRITGYGLLTEVKSIENLSIGVNLPIPAANTDTVDVLKGTDLGVTYKIDGIGNLIALANLNLVTERNIVNFGFNLTAVDKLALRVLYKGDFNGATDVSTNWFDVNARYDLGALKVGALFHGILVTDKDLDWNAIVRADYKINDDLSARFFGRYRGTETTTGETFDAYAQGTYAFGGGLSTTLRAGYTDRSDTGLYVQQTLWYSVSF